MKKFMEEFKAFALKGNVMDMAVGIIIGGAFSTIVKSLVDDILMPLLGMLLGRVNISDLNVTVGSAKLTYGTFLQNIINFIFIALAVFMIVRMINRAEKKKEEKPAEPSKEEMLLTEIRDALVKKNG